jgi:hypothetical protein
MRPSLEFVGKCPQHQTEMPFIEGKPFVRVLEVYNGILGFYAILRILKPNQVKLETASQ